MAAVSPHFTRGAPPMPPADATAQPPFAAPTVEDHLHRVVAAEGPPQRRVEVPPLAPDDEQEPTDRLGHAASARLRAGSSGRMETSAVAANPRRGSSRPAARRAG